MNKFLQFFSLFFLLFSGLTLSAQNVGINSTGVAPDAGSLLDITSTNKGLLIPRVSIANLTTIAPITGSATTSMLVYNTNAGTGLGYYYWDGADWIRFTTGGVTGSCGTINYVPKMTSSTSIGCSQIFDNGTNVGIGTVSPGYKLHTIGDIYANGGWLRVSGNRGLYFESWGGGFYMTDGTWIRTYGNKNFYHNTGIMRTDGTLQVGGSGNYLKVPNGGTEAVFNEISANYDFRVESNTRTHALFVDAGNDVVRIGSGTGALTGNGGTIYDYLGGAVTTINYVADLDNGITAGSTFGLGSVEFLTDGLNEVFIGNADLSPDVDGAAVLGWANSWGAIYSYNFFVASDKRSKKNIEPLNLGLTTLMNMNTYKYNYISDEYDQLHFGFIAQEIDDLAPNLVNKFRYKHITEGGADRVDKIERKRWAVNYLEIVPITVKAIQEQQKIIEEQNKRIDNLEKIIKELQGK